MDTDRDGQGRRLALKPVLIISLTPMNDLDGSGLRSDTEQINWLLFFFPRGFGFSILALARIDRNWSWQTKDKSSLLSGFSDDAQPGRGRGRANSPLRLSSNYLYLAVHLSRVQLAIYLLCTGSIVIYRGRSSSLAVLIDFFLATARFSIVPHNLIRKRTFFAAILEINA